MNTTCKGSPPLAWGIPFSANQRGEPLRITPTCVGNTVILNVWFSLSVRITPTCVGNTARLVFSLQTLEDHPHLRGEYLGGQNNGKPCKGSPPLAWGIQKPGTFWLLGNGITPTCVGNTVAAWTTEVCCRDHPHLRGEYLQCCRLDN